MSPLITYTLIGFITLYIVFIMLDLLTSQNIKRLLLEGLPLFGAILLLNVTTGFPRPVTKQAFGDVSSLLSICIMFFCTVLGIAARYFFSLQGRFSWRSFFKPLCISPIILLPLIESVQGAAKIESIQLISFGFLAFQNGFFWKVIFERAERSRQGRDSIPR